jgi:hypothetical protein
VEHQAVLLAWLIPEGPLRLLRERREKREKVCPDLHDEPSAVDCLSALPDLIHVVPARLLPPHELPGARDGIGVVDAFALVADPEHGGSTS